jgi:hypothetical protein
MSLSKNIQCVRCLAVVPRRGPNHYLCATCRQEAATERQMLRRRGLDL